MVPWLDAHGALRVTVHRAGSLTFTDPDPTMSGSGGGVALLASGLGDAIPAGFRFEWPVGVASDSVVFDIALTRSMKTLDFLLPRSSFDTPEEVFTVRMPLQYEPAREIRPARITYPSSISGRSATGYVTLAFVIDTAGRVEMKTVREVWGNQRPEVMRDMGRYYHDFVIAVRRGLPTARYEPERLGGCPIRSQVQQSFHFKSAPGATFPPPPLDY
jgi:hypothetical protein